MQRSPPPARAQFSVIGLRDAATRADRQLYVRRHDGTALWLPLMSLVGHPGFSAALLRARDAGLLCEPATVTAPVMSPAASPPPIDAIADARFEALMSGTTTPPAWGACYGMPEDISFAAEAPPAMHSAGIADPTAVIASLNGTVAKLRGQLDDLRRQEALLASDDGRRQLKRDVAMALHERDLAKVQADRVLAENQRLHDELDRARADIDRLAAQRADEIWASKRNALEKALRAEADAALEAFKKLRAKNDSQRETELNGLRTTLANERVALRKANDDLVSIKASVDAVRASERAAEGRVREVSQAFEDMRQGWMSDQTQQIKTIEALRAELEAQRRVPAAARNAAVEASVCALNFQQDEMRTLQAQLNAVVQDRANWQSLLVSLTSQVGRLGQDSLETLWKHARGDKMTPEQLRPALMALRDQWQPVVSSVNAVQAAFQPQPQQLAQ